MRNFCTWGHHWKTPIDNFSIFPKSLPGIKTPKKDELIILGSPLGLNSQADILERKSTNWKKLDAHYGFFMLKNCFSMPKLLYFLRTSTGFNNPDLLEWDDKTVREGLSKVCNVNFDNISSTQLALISEMGALGVSFPSLLALPAFLASAFSASDFLTTNFSETFEDVSFTKALEKWLSLTIEQESRPLDGTQKNWTQPVFVKTAQEVISRMNHKRSGHGNMFERKRSNYSFEWT